MNLVWKLLKAHLSGAQLAGFFIANLTGTVILLLCLQAYSDLQAFYGEDDRVLKKDYLIVTKKVSTWNILSGKSNLFSEHEIEELRHQPFAGKVAGFTASAFRVTAGMEVGGRGFATEMFFESVPDEYIDVRTDYWHFNEEEGIIPVIVPRNYLNLYNFGFAQARNLPKISENVIGMLQLDIRLEGNGLRKQYKGKIAGFSNRLNTILVPEQFMTWANQTFAPDKKHEVARLILETPHSSDIRISRYFENKGYESENAKAATGKILWFFRMVTASVMGVGIIICLLAFYILTLSIYLLIQKDSKKLRDLFLIGYAPDSIAWPYQRLAVVLNGSVVAMAGIIVYSVRLFYLGRIEKIWPEFVPAVSWSLPVAVVVLFLLSAGINRTVIRRKVRKAVL